MASDTNAFSTPQMVSEALGFSCVTNVNQMETEGGGFDFKKRGGMAGSKKKFRLKPPLVLSVDKGISEPKYPSLPGIMKAKKKPFHESRFEDFNAPAPKVLLKKLSPPPEKPPGRILKGSVSDQCERTHTSFEDGVRGTQLMAKKVLVFLESEKDSLRASAS